MNRREFLMLPAIAAVAQKPGERKFYITGLYHTEEFNDCTLPPIVSYGTDRINALLNTGVTVWEAADFEEIDPSFREVCQERKKEEDSRG